MGLYSFKASTGVEQSHYLMAFDKTLSNSVSYVEMRRIGFLAGNRGALLRDSAQTKLIAVALHKNVAGTADSVIFYKLAEATLAVELVSLKNHAIAQDGEVTASIDNSDNIFVISQAIGKRES